ncbi:TIGR02186 family protein [Altererythrobacter sp. ZODW24]|uniref:TIGR02186 family protein n=1 Tax=Altererythrobacter sp. ZODW24 TaxID=2185142 RepID=UPI000DF82220|nr:TIGR02186 family protein [Altererythrobacter sp. ZODW24]
MIRLVALFVMALMLTGARDPILVPEVSQHDVQVRQGFTGTELLLFGAILDPEGRAARDYDIVVVLKGPAEAIRVREKRKVAGIWINADSTAFQSAPSFFAVVSSKPISELVDEKTAAIYELGLDFVQFSPTGKIDPAEQARFSAGFNDMRKRAGLYKEDMSGVQVSKQVLYQARISLPSNVQTGTYTAETFAITRGRVIASEVSEVEVRKVGFERFVETSAQNWGVFYGLIAVALSVMMGWLAGRLFAMV